MAELESVFGITSKPVLSYVERLRWTTASEMRRVAQTSHRVCLVQARELRLYRSTFLTLTICW